MKYDLVILGGGSGAFAAATKANDLGVKTALINDREIGGTCVNRGCVPSKFLLEIGNLLYYPQHTEFESVNVEKITFDFRMAIREKRDVVEKLRQSNYRNVIENMDSIDLFEGKGRFVDSNKVEVDGNVIEGKNFIIATGILGLLVGGGIFAFIIAIEFIIGAIVGDLLESAVKK